MRSRAIKVIAVLIGGGCVTLAQASARFGWIGQPGAVFFPETLAQWMFAWIPIELFSLGLSVLGKSAKWYAFYSMIGIWAVGVGAVVYLGVEAAARAGARRGVFTWLIPGLFVALVVESLSRAASLQGSAGGGWASLLLVAAAYLAAAWMAFAARNSHGGGRIA